MPAAVAPADLQQVVADYARDGVVKIRGLFSREEVANLRQLLDDYIRTKLSTLPPAGFTLEPDGVTVRNLWAIQKYDERFVEVAHDPRLLEMVSTFVHGEPVLAAIETFNKPAKVGSAVPHHQDNAYFCQSPPDMLTVWIAIDAATLDNGPIYYFKGSHKLGMLPSRKSGVSGNSMGMADIPDVPLAEQFCGTLEPGDAIIHHCQTIHHSAPNRSDNSRLGFLLVYRAAHTQTDPVLQAAYTSK